MQRKPLKGVDAISISGLKLKNGQDLVMTKELCTKKSAGAGARSTSPSNLWASKNLISAPSVPCFSHTTTYSSASRRDHEFVSRLVSFSMFIPYSISVD